MTMTHWHTENGIYQAQVTDNTRYVPYIPAIQEKSDFGQRDTLYLLDIGSSTGEAVDGFVSAYWESTDRPVSFETVALDPAKDVLNDGRIQGYADEPVGGLAQSLPFDTDSFDLVISHYCLPNLGWGHQAAAVNEIGRVLKPDGVTAVDLANDTPLSRPYVFTGDELDTVLDETDDFYDLPFTERSAYHPEQYQQDDGSRYRMTGSI